MHEQELEGTNQAYAGRFLTSTRLHYQWKYMRATKMGSTYGNDEDPSSIGSKETINYTKNASMMECMDPS
jgi:hypothetical protein